MSILIQKRGKRLIFTLSIGLLAACASTPEPAVETVFIKKESTVSRAITNPAKSSGMIALETARKMLGVPYRYGGTDPHGFDCSGLTMVVYRINGLNLPRSSRQQWKAGKPIGRRQLQKGDLVFFATARGNKVSHVGIYAGGNKFLHAPGRGRRIQTSSLSSKYYSARYVGARSYL